MCRLKLPNTEKQLQKKRLTEKAVLYVLEEGLGHKSVAADAV